MQTIAIAVRDGTLFLIARVQRAATGDVYVNHRRPGRKWKPHSSYHASGEHHHVTFGKKPAHAIRQAQKPDFDFKGAEPVAAFVVSPTEHKAVNSPCDPAKYDAVFEIAADSLLADGRSRIHVDFVEPGRSPTLPAMGESILQQQDYRDTVPWIVLT